MQTKQSGSFVTAADGNVKHCVRVHMSQRPYSNWSQMKKKLQEPLLPSHY